LGIVLVIVVTLTCVVTYMQNAKSEALMASFKKFIPQSTKVLRGGNVITIPSRMLVPGDIVFIKEGDKIPADVRIIKSNEMRVNNSSLTGETKELLRTTECTNPKNALETDNLCFFGTICKKGDAEGIVISIGDNTIIG